MAKKEERQREILSALGTKEEMDVEELATMFSLTPATIRRDLTDLEQEGRVIRTHGGVRINSDPMVIAHRFNDRKTVNVPEKERLAIALAKAIPEGASVMLDNGSTNWYLAKQLKQKSELMVVTNSLSIMLEFANVETDIEVVLAGGHYRKRNLDFVDTSVSEFLKTFYVDYAVLTCDAFRPGQGFFKKSSDSAMIAHTICGCANQVIVVADHTKLDERAPHLFADDDKVHQLFTTRELEKNKLDTAYKITYC